MHSKSAAGPTSSTAAAGGLENLLVVESVVKGNSTIEPYVQILLIRVLQSSTRFYYLLLSETLHTKGGTVVPIIREEQGHAMRNS